jgi:NAD-dependent SIR2 family protein deacetylase
MKFVISSGAGLSAPSGLPVYESLCYDKSYVEFFEANEDRALDVATSFFATYRELSPNAAHYKCYLEVRLYVKSSQVRAFYIF